MDFSFAYKYLFVGFVLGLFAVQECYSDDVSRCPPALPRNLRNRHLYVHKDKCYMFVNDEVDWPNANSHCRASGGTMITITRRDIQLFVESVLRTIWHNNGMWLGAHDRHREMDWFWVTGERSRGGRGYENWAHGQPSCFLLDFMCHEDCACLRVDEGYRWHDYLCSSSAFEYGFACQYDLVAPPKTTTPKPTTTLPTTTPTTTTLTTKPTTKQPTVKTSIQWTTLPEVKTIQHKSSSLQAGESTPANVSVIVAGPGNYINVKSDRYAHQAEEKNSEPAGVYIAVIIPIVLIAILIVFILFFRRRRRKQYAESLSIGFNNVLYTATPVVSSPTHAKETNIAVAATYYEDTDDDCTLENKYVDIDDVVVAGAKYVDLPTCKGGAGPSNKLADEPIYDTVKCMSGHREVESGAVGGVACYEGGDSLAPPPACGMIGHAPTNTGAQISQFTPDFLKKESNLTKAYNNNLYGTKK